MKETVIEPRPWLQRIQAEENNGTSRRSVPVVIAEFGRKASPRVLNQ
jgi:hypothetical protein